ncbi:hypothetical protein ENU1_170660 [Entamoeba nuttalli P19]|uniref:Uncharacterized protein n=1 Tax=Entamoeba nuttalli (strain P19) TaxID=1076696 RepID=K2HQR7_ENTNP|nr:hypothetical protein ENU1_170660 [Entamoeba nuttalli P19]EKE38295.1 hypothetical protein ENU1_170660 [Entamoeba nuttalli P19]|eukprot:XP_008859364.1 hypothetical protein ENU1_170660 [Entamoeba nuttalli P19]
MSGCRPLAYQVDDEKGENNKKINVLKKKFGDDHNVHGVIPYVLKMTKKNKGIGGKKTNLQLSEDSLLTETLYVHIDGVLIRNEEVCGYLKSKKKNK